MSCGVKYGDYSSENLYTWCTNCGNYGIAAATKRALTELCIEPHKVVMCFDIGCNGNGSDKVGGYRFHGLHGRVIPFAAGVHLANEALPVIASAGDGATLSEGINHLIHAIRCNYNVTFMLHNNCNYGLTKGQASSTTPQDTPMSASPDGVSALTLNVMEMVITLGATFAARTFSGDVNHMTDTFKQGILHKGFSVIEIMQSCPTYNKATPHEWYQQNSVYLGHDFDSSNRQLALEACRDLHSKLALGVIYQDPSSRDFMGRQANRVGINTNLVDEVSNFDISQFVADYI